MEFKEPHFNWILESAKKHKAIKFPIATSESYRRDPRSLLFKLSRYKAVAKILEGSDKVLEIGCGDGFAAPIVRQHVNNLTISDVDPIFVQMARNFLHGSFDIEVVEIKWSAEQGIEIFGRFKSAYCLDVLEHIPVDQEKIFLKSVTMLLEKQGLFIAGIPSIESQQFTTPENAVGHVNIKSTSEYADLLKLFFDTVIVLGMNDEVLHTGFTKMRSYNLFLCSGIKE
jgi:2-polyprenyl-3-methyl-5-hydroxy-6-metoxy-1,4-benzoquinol methylase